MFVVWVTFANTEGVRVERFVAASLALLEAAVDAYAHVMGMRALGARASFAGLA